MAEEKIRLGGMALGNGLLVHGPTHWAAAIRTANGDIDVASGRKPKAKGRSAELPGIRGVVRLGEAFAVIPLVKINLPEAKLPFQDFKVLAAMASTTVLSSLIRIISKRGAVAELAVGALGVAPALIALRNSDLAIYHGVEHKAIGAYEADADVAEIAKEHERCGSNLVAPMLIATALGNALLQKLNARRSPIARLAVSVGSAAVAVELFAWGERNRDKSLAKALKIPGYEMQRLFVTREPGSEQIEVGERAIEEILKAESAT